ncbi:MAG: hypothetical protein QXF68_01390 [Thermofilaceae archaeon]
MKKRLILLLLVALQLVGLAYPQPFRVGGAKILPGGSILAWGEIPENNTVLPIIAIIDTAGRVRDALCLTVSNARLIVLDALEDDGRIVAGGIVVREGQREAFAARFNSGTVDWAFSLQQGVYFVKALTKLSNEYVLFGLTSGASDSDIAVVFVDEKATVQRALRFGCPMYDDFVEKAFTRNQSLLIVGSTWCQNVSYVDALLVNMTAGLLQSITVGGAAHDEGLAAKVLDGKMVVVGSSFTSPGGLSDAYLAILNGTDLKVLTVGWQSYDGFIDVCGSLTNLYLLGYATMDVKTNGILIRLTEGAVASALLVECDESIVPLAIGYEGDRLVAVFKATSALVLVTFDHDLKPLTAFTVGESSFTTLRVRSIRDVKKNVHNVSDRWRIQRLQLSLEPINVSLNPLNLEVNRLSLVSRPLRIEVGEYVEEIPLSKSLIRAIEQNIPLIIILVPLLAVLLIVIITARRPR